MHFWILLFPLLISAGLLKTATNYFQNKFAPFEIGQCYEPQQIEEQKKIYFFLNKLDRKDLTLPLVEEEKICYLTPYYISKRIEPYMPLPRNLIDQSLWFRYRITKEMSRGRNNVVLLAQDRKDGQEFVFKCSIRPLIVNDEYEIWRQIYNPQEPGSEYIVSMKLYEWRSHQWLKMPLFDMSLFDLLKNKDFVPTFKLIRPLMKDILKGLAYVHSKGFVHGDMKPDNILLKKNNHILHPFIHDFEMGIRNNKKAYNPRGTPAYIAPEVYWELEWTTGADIWAIGVIFVDIYSESKKYLTDYTKNGVDFYNWMPYLDYIPLQIIDKLNQRIQDVPRKMNTKFYTEQRPLQSWSSLLPYKEAYGDHEEYSALIDLMTLLMNWDHHKRITAEEALKHPFFTK